MAGSAAVWRQGTREGTGSPAGRLLQTFGISVKVALAKAVWGVGEELINSEWFWKTLKTDFTLNPLRMKPKTY